MTESYDAFAPRYDELFAERQKAKIKGLAVHLPPSIQGPRLDAGCGTGLASRILGREFISLDRSTGMLAHAPRPRVRGDMVQLPFSNNTFGLVLSISAVLDATPLNAALSELHRVLRAGGVLALSILKTEDLTRAEFIMNELFGQRPRRIDLGPDLGFVVEKRVGSL